jgi:hypothetical protein
MEIQPPPCPPIESLYDDVDWVNMRPTEIKDGFRNVVKGLDRLERSIANWFCPACKQNLKRSEKN